MKRRYPKNSFVGIMVADATEPPFPGQVILYLGSGDGRLLWQCEHEHPTTEDAFACARREFDRDGTAGA